MPAAKRPEQCGPGLSTTAIRIMGADVVRGCTEFATARRMPLQLAVARIVRAGLRALAADPDAGQEREVGP